MKKTSTDPASLKTKTDGATARSLEHFGNNDRRIPYYKLRLEQSLDDIKEKDLPSEYHYENYAPGDKAAWIAIEKSAKEFLIVAVSVAVAGLAIFFFDRKILINVGLDAEQARRSALWLAVITAPYLYFFPSRLLY